jgi:hypothetical protein
MLSAQAMQTSIQSHYRLPLIDLTIPDTTVPVVGETREITVDANAPRLVLRGNSVSFLTAGDYANAYEYCANAIDSTPYVWDGANYLVSGTATTTVTTGSITYTNTGTGAVTIYSTPSGGTGFANYSVDYNAATAIVSSYDYGQYYTIDGGGTLTVNGVITEEMRKNFASQEKRARLRQNMVVRSVSRQIEIKQRSAAELVARRTLRDMLLESEYRRYLTNGFIMVKGASGKFYQIFSDQRHIKVYEKGVLTDELCIRTVENCPPTDHVISMKLMAELEEHNLWKESNVYKKKPSLLLVGAAS